MNREVKALLKKAKHSKPSKYQALKAEFEEYKRNNAVKISLINELREEVEHLKRINEKKVWEDDIAHKIQERMEALEHQGDTIRLNELGLMQGWLLNREDY